MDQPSHHQSENIHRWGILSCLIYGLAITPPKWKHPQMRHSVMPYLWISFSPFCSQSLGCVTYFQKHLVVQKWWYASVCVHTSQEMTKEVRCKGQKKCKKLQCCVKWTTDRSMCVCRMWWSLDLQRPRRWWMVRCLSRRISAFIVTAARSLAWLIWFITSSATTAQAVAVKQQQGVCMALLQAGIILHWDNSMNSKTLATLLVKNLTPVPTTTEQ